MEVYLGKVWKGERWLENWKEGIIVLIRKKREGKEVGDYRGVTLMPSLYKIYTMILAEIEGRGREERNITTNAQDLGRVWGH